MPFAVAEHDGVLTLTLDTPRSAVNILNHDTAHQLIDVLAGVRPSSTRAIVFETAKQNSFINGVGLLLAHASRTYEDIRRASMPPWTAYRAVRESPVPTIAIVQGNCFGCGVEFALSCDYRLATDSVETRFYMTEVNGYLFVPLFCGTRNLPQTVGLTDAVELLLDGAPWSAEKAWQHGLVDETVAHEDLAERKGRFIERVLAGTQPSRRQGPVTWSAREDSVVERTRQRIACLPPQYRTLYADALGLLTAGARQAHSYDAHQRHELACAAENLLSPAGKAAAAFFYLREMAAERAAGRARDDATPAVMLHSDVPPDAVARPFADDLRARKLPGVAFDGRRAADFPMIAADGRPSSVSAPNGAVADEGGATNGQGRDVAVRVTLARGPSVGIELYAPTYGAGGRLVELASRVPVVAGVADPAIRLARTLRRFGFEVARTTPGDTFVITRLLVAYLVPLVRFVELHGDVGAVNATLHDAGFVRSPHTLLTAFDRATLACEVASVLGHAPAAVEPVLAALESGRGGSGDDVIVDALCVSLLDAVLSVRERREVRSTSIVDLIARELLDFPRHLCSLATWLKVERVGRALAGGERVRSLVTDGAVESARAFVAAGRELYR